MRYNHFRVGAWCSGSTWASDSHGVGSIPIAPANALHPREKRGCIFMPARLGLPKCGRGIKITPRKRCKALNPPKGADGSPRSGYYYGSCLSEPNPHFKFFPLYRPSRLAEARAGIKITPRKRCKALNPLKGADGSPRRGYYYGSCPSICVFCLFTPHHFTARLGLPKRGRGIK